MTDLNAQQLIAALAPVQRHHRPGEVSANSVLAAYLRAADIQPKGEAWDRAKEALARTNDFDLAVRATASETGKSARSKEIPQATITRATDVSGAHASRGPLDWFPQRFEPGAIQGAGAKKLLGTPDVSMEELLVRETAQNSWDARIGDRPVEFTLNLRQLTSETTNLLLNSVFTGAATGTRVNDELSTGQIGAMEISDRGTVGLGGPVRNDRAIPQNSVTHFIDLVFNIGATKSDLTSGGTYGFGKSITYMVSEVGAIVIWSRCATDRGPEDRLIASAIGEVFERDGYRYTGRHWWGRSVDGRPEPIVGSAARDLGEQLFAKPFGKDELGTSILILAPVLGAPGPEDDAAVLTEAVLWNLWPKLLRGESGMYPMEIRVEVDGVDHPIPNPSTHPILSGPVSCLRAVRAVQAGTPPPQSLFAIDITEIKRYNEILGHVALMKYPVANGAASGQRNSHAVTLMRHGAELVVRNMERASLAEPGFQWAGVFKPVGALDPTFARSEPPAHDDWSPASLQDKTQRSQVKLAMQRIQEAADRFVEPYIPALTASSTTSTAHVGDMLAGLMAGSSGSAPSRARNAGRSGGSRSSKPSAQLGAPQWTDSATPGWTRTVVPVRVVGGPPAGSRVRVEIGIGTDGGTERQVDLSYLRDGGWEGQEGAVTALIPPGGEWNYWFESSDAIAVDVTTRIMSEDGDE